MIKIYERPQIPIYKQIKQQIKQKILNKELNTGDQLPSIRSLARQIQVGIITTTKVYDELVLEGYLISRPGIGFFVNELNHDLIISIQKDLIRDDVIELLTKLKETTLTKKDLIEMINELEEK